MVSTLLASVPDCNHALAENVVMKRPKAEIPKIDSFLCQKCGRDLFTCKGHNNDIEIIGREALFARGEWWWEIASNNDMVLSLMKQEAVAKLLHEAGFFDWLYKTSQPIPKPEIHVIVPDGMELLPFQVEGVQRMYYMNNVLLADEMGLGKTIQVLAYINSTKPRRVLVICPNSVKLNWQREAETWLVDKYDMEVASYALCTMSDFTIINYEALAVWGVPLAQQPWDLVVIDEAHLVKNKSTKRAKAVFSLKSSKVIMLTGTPIVNYPYELFPLIHHLAPDDWPSAYEFEDRYVYGRQKKYSRNLPELQRYLREGKTNGPLMIRRLKKDVLKDLPKKRRQIVELPSEGLEELIEEEKKIWEGTKHSGAENDVLVDILKIIENAQANETHTEAAFQALIEGLKYNKQYAFTEISRIRHKVALAKVPMVLDHLDTVLDWLPGIDTEADSKIVVFGHHRDVLKQIKDHYGDAAVLVFGGDSIESRQEAVDRFQNDPKCRVFCGGLTVAGVGLTLTAASHVVFAEIDWVPGVLTQAEDRVHRIGQDADSVLIQHLVLENSLDAHMAKTIIRKQKQIDKAVN